MKSRNLWIQCLVLNVMLTGAIGIGSFASVSYGQEADSSSTPTKKKKKKKKKKKTEEPTSEESTTPSAKPEVSVGSGKKWQVLANAGLDPSPFIGIGGTIGRSISPSLALEGFFSRAAGKVEPVAITVMSAGFRLRKSFFGRIPYIAGGLGFQTATGSWFTYNKLQTDELATSSAANAVTINLALGGQMQFGAFVIGADLAGIAYPIAKMGVKDTVPSEEYDQADFDEQKAKFTKQASGMSVILGKVGIGIAF